MSTFLELSQELRRLCGIQGSGPTAVATAVGIEERLVNYTKNAWIDIQAHPKQWRWMIRDYYQSGTTPLQTVVDTANYQIATGVNGVEDILIESFYCYLTATGQSDRQPMHWMPWREFKEKYFMVQPSASSDRPIVVTLRPQDRNLVLYPTPNDIYSIEFEHFKTPTVMSADGDSPNVDDGFPLQFERLIVYEAMKRFGKAEDAPEVIRAGEEEAGSEGGEGRLASGMWRALIFNQEVRYPVHTHEETQMTVVPE